jgi:hypothetical protein
MRSTLARRIARSTVVCCLLLAAAGPARAADPLLMFLLGFAKNLIESAIEDNAARPVPVAPAPLAPAVPAVPQKTPAQLDANDLRVLVDDSFAYLDGSQRTELLAGLQRALDDPANEPYRAQILTQFVAVAHQVRFAHRQLDRLSPEDKRIVAERFATNYRALAPEQQQAISRQLQARALPVPADLNDMMLSALAAVR